MMSTRNSQPKLIMDARYVLERRVGDAVLMLTLCADQERSPTVKLVGQQE